MLDALWQDIRYAIRALRRALAGAPSTDRAV